MGDSTASRSIQNRLGIHHRIYELEYQVTNMKGSPRSRMIPHRRRISVVGLGYVGLQVAVAFGKHEWIIGFDTDPIRIRELEAGFDRTREVDQKDLTDAKVRYTCDSSQLKTADFHIVAVPTPIDELKRPDLSQLLEASRTLGAQLKVGDIVVYESTVYPGATEEECIPVLEVNSGLRSGSDFFVGYSPERINPGDRNHTFTEIVKVVSGQTPDTLDIMAAAYGSVVAAGVHRAPSIKTAEAAKVIENTQRDLNIALMNEFALILNLLDIDTQEALLTAGTKWNFLPFTPGLVGGHCVGVDPYYLTYKAIQVGYDPQVVLAGRKINDEMGRTVARLTIKFFASHGLGVRGSTITVLGLSFKENVPDLRNSRVIDIVCEFEEQGALVQVHDPLVDKAEAKREYGVNLHDRAALVPADAVVLAVGHREYVNAGWGGVTELLVCGRGVVADLRNILDIRQAPEGIALWRL